ncbi:FAD-dependent oxidoreductase [Halobellus marinus]|uniref:FAD-dependent oxidoreductase n=1 Tax=Halobellus marinus TaxID=3075123 RepID=UPI003CE4D0C3
MTDTRDLDRIGFESNEDGFVPTDEYERTDVNHVFAVNDVSGEPMPHTSARKKARSLPLRLSVGIPRLGTGLSPLSRLTPQKSQPSR